LGVVRGERYRDSLRIRRQESQPATQVLVRADLQIAGIVTCPTSYGLMILVMPWDFLDFVVASCCPARGCEDVSIMAVCAGKVCVCTAHDYQLMI
jgi:hypothetical protein